MPGARSPPQVRSSLVQEPNLPSEVSGAALRPALKGRLRHELTAWVLAMKWLFSREETEPGGGWKAVEGCRHYVQ